jgi:hypothetical protein
MAYRRRNHFPLAVHALQQIALGEFHAVSQVVESLLALADKFHHSSKSPVLRQFGKSLTTDQEAVAHGAG